MTTATAHHPTAPFWDRIARKYAAQPVADPVAYEDKLHHLRMLLRDTDRVLEIGCGTGSTALRLAPHAADYIAADLSGAMIGIAERKRRDAGATNLRFVVAEAADPLPGAPFDVVMAFSLLHLVADPNRALAAVFAQLRPGGLFVSKTVCLGDAGLGVRLLVRVLGLVGIAPPVTPLTAAGLRRALVEAGFAIVEQRHFGKGRTSPFIVARRPA